MKNITEKQQLIYDAICRYLDKNGYPPSVREICRLTGLSSTSSVHFHLESLERMGYISRGSGKTRAITVCERTSGVPILGAVAAGSPILAVEDAVGTIPYEAGEDGEYFALEIRGQSMIKAGIMDGDMVIVKRQPTARSGEIVIALLGEEATCKRLQKRGGEVLLLPENDEYEPINGREAVILGKVTAVIRTY